MFKSRPEVVVLASYIAQYRAPFFELAASDLESRGVVLTVAVGGVDSQQASRNDGVELPGQLRLGARALRVAGRDVVWRDSRRLAESADLVVMEQARKYLDTYVHLLGRRHRPVALWGHGRTTTRTTSAWEHRLLDALTRRADWFFAYTERGRREMAVCGFPDKRITVVQNATDTAALRSAAAAVTASERTAISRQLGLTKGRTALYLGALDESKRLGLLMAAGAALADRMPGFTLVVAGDGPMRSVIEQAAATSSWLRYVGAAFGSDKAVLGTVSDVMLNPGRVGLTVVDSFAMGVPMVTTEWRGHAPEFDYIDPDVNGVVTRDSLTQYVATVESLLQSPDRLKGLRAACIASCETYRIEAMAARFVSGVTGALGAGRRQTLRGSDRVARARTA